MEGRFTPRAVADHNPQDMLRSIQTRERSVANRKGVLAMKNKVGLVLFLLFSFVLLIGIGGAFSQNTPVPAYAASSARTPIVSDGVPAIQAAPNTTNGGTSPAITTQDVSNFVNSQSGIFRVDIVGNPTIANIQLVTISQAGVVLQQRLSLPGSISLVYLVTFSNNVHPALAPGVAPSAVTADPTLRAYEIFDAQSGNVLVTGTWG